MHVKCMCHLRASEHVAHRRTENPKTFWGDSDACRECENQYNALYEVTGCCSCTNDKAVFTGDVMSTCAGLRTQDACSSDESRQKVDAIICNILEPSASLGCPG